MAETSAASRHVARRRAATILAEYLERISHEDWVVALHHDGEEPWVWYVRLTGDERDYVAMGDR